MCIFAVFKEYVHPLFPTELETSNNSRIYKTHVLKQGSLTDITECKKLLFNSVCLLLVRFLHVQLGLYFSRWC